MASLCELCAVRGTERCPYKDGSQDLENGCYHYIKRVEPCNEKRKPSKCGNCRFLFRKAKAALGDKSYVMCGAIPSLVQKIQPSPHCPYYKQKRKKYQKKQTGRNFNFKQGRDWK